MDKEANLFLHELYKRMPIQEKHPYFNLDSEQLYQKYRFMFEFYEDNFEKLVCKDNQAKILDIGFGFGAFMVYLKRKGFRHICGVEYNQAQVKNAEKMGFQAELIANLGDYLKNNRNQFDLIHASSVVEHFPKYDLIEIFDLLKDALKDNGKLVVAVPNIAGWRGIYNRYMVLGHEIGFTEVSLEQIFQVSGFNNIKIFGSQIRFRPRIKHILMRIMQKIFNLIIGVIDYIYLGENKPRYQGQHLLGVGIKKSA